SSTERARSDLLFASGFDPLGPGKQPSPQGVNFGRRSGVNFEGRLTPLPPDGDHGRPPSSRVAHHSLEGLRK
ncbi:MAG TPA: hypothetical protein VGO22_16205, partial [Pseudorhizobium sp.]|nr:hypothetical protein [Pseudorhizobium sp.]